VERFLVAYKSAVKADPKVGDKVDDEVRRLFLTVRRRDNEMQSVATQLPERHIIDQQIYIPKMLEQVTALTRLVEEMNTKMDNQSSLLRWTIKILRWKN
jgi:hypothetical protein